MAGSLATLARPPLFTWFTGPLIPIGLAVSMLGMGLTLELEDFRRDIKRPVLVVLGVVLQYTRMLAAGSWPGGVLPGGHA